MVWNNWPPKCPVVDNIEPATAWEFFRSLELTLSCQIWQKVSIHTHPHPKVNSSLQLIYLYDCMSWIIFDEWLYYPYFIFIFKTIETKYFMYICIWLTQYKM